MKCSWMFGSLVGATFVAWASAQSGVRLTAGDATFDYAFGGNLPAQSNGALGNVSTNFQLGGAPGAAGNNWMPNANWFYRFQGDNRERQLTTTTGGVQVLNGTNEVDYFIPTMFTGGAAATQVPDATGHMHFLLTDTGLDRARLNTEFCIQNDGSTTLEADIFFVANIDIFATPGNDTFAPLVTSPNYLWTGADGLANAAMLGPGAIGAASGTAAATMTQMTDPGLDSFNPVIGPGGTLPPTDAYLALQFHAIVPPMMTNCYGIQIDIAIAVPEPTTAGTLLLFGAVALARRRA